MSTPANSDGGGGTPSAPPAPARAAPAPAPVATRAATRDQQIRLIKEYYGGNKDHYETAITLNADEACLRFKSLLASVNTRCEAYLKSKRVAPQWITALQQDEETAKRLTEEYCACLERILTFDLVFREGANVDRYRDQIQNARGRFTDAQNQLVDCLAYCESTVAEYTASSSASSPRSNGRGRTRHTSDEDTDDRDSGKMKAQIKPDKLVASATPAQLNKWVDILRCYIEYSNLTKASKFYQQQICFSLMDETLSSYLQSKIDDSSPIFGDDNDNIRGTPRPGSLIAYLFAKFEATHPLSSRRAMLFKLCQQQGQPWSSFYSKWDMCFRNADLEKYLQGEVIQVELLMANTIDKELVDRFQRLTDPSIEDLVSTATKYEADMKAQKAMRVGDNGPQARRADTNGGRQQKYQGGNKDNHVRAHFKKLEAEGRCHRCGERKGSKSTEEHNSVCKAKDAYCKYCESKKLGERAKGHFEAVCSKKLRPPPRARRASAEGDEEQPPPYDEEPTARSAHVSSSEEEEFDGPRANYITVLSDGDDSDDSDSEYDTPDSGPDHYSESEFTDSDHDSDHWHNAEDDWIGINSDDSDEYDADTSDNDDNIFAPTAPAYDGDDWNMLPGHYSYCDDNESDSDSGDSYGEDGWRIKWKTNPWETESAEDLWTPPAPAEDYDWSMLPGLYSYCDESESESELSSTSDNDEHSGWEIDHYWSDFIENQGDILNSHGYQEQEQPVACLLEDISTVPKNVPIPLFNVQFREHERRGNWHSISAVADTGANRTIFSMRVIEVANIKFRQTGRERIRLANTSASIASCGHAFLRLKTPSDSKKDYTVVNALMGE